MEVSKELISPAVAELMLRDNIKNRSISKINLQRIIDQMNDDEWQEDTGEAIKIAKDGTLLDGQHRLSAVVATGKSYEFLVIRDLPNKAFNVIDTGKPRSAADALHIIGVKSFNVISAMIKKYLYLKSGKVHNKMTERVASTTKVIEEYEKAPEEWLNVNKKSSHLYLQGNRLLQQSMIGGWYKFLYETEPDECDVFFNKLCTGIGLESERDPIYVFRNMLIENRSSDKKMTVFAKNAYFIVTWNSYLQGRKYISIPWRYGKDDIPTPYRTKQTALEVLK